MSQQKSQFIEGARQVLPSLPGIVPFGMIAGIAALQVGFTPVQAVSFSLFVFAGASQLAAIELLGKDAAIWVVVLTALIVNLRLIMYSASLAPYLESVSKRWKFSLAYLLVDQVYALALVKFRTDDIEDPRWFYLGAAIPSWLVWEGSTVAGVLLGTGVPSAWQLGFAVPLLFLALLVPTIEDLATGAAGVVAGVVAVAGISAPYELGLIIGAGAGIAIGTIVSWGRQ